MRRLRTAGAILLLLLAGLPAAASDVGLSGRDGHPRERLPLAVHLASFGDPALDATAAKAVDDWNHVAREALGAEVFRRVAEPSGAQVVVEAQPRDPRGVMGFAAMQGGDGGVIALPVRVVVHEPAARGQTSRETILYQVLAHELGHALGLPHTTDPRSLMCCVHASLDFNDPAVRAAYVESRRHPDVGSARAQLTAHYERFWRGRDEGRR
ncbi:MAG: matrixin family metalloprotease [Candidatus Rokubacteria bacterium]|nr:matrixin family metalloprotease [Candidatus Rokubacteria bacterium]